MLRVNFIFATLIIVIALATCSIMLCQKHEETTTRAWFKVVPAEDTEVFERVLECRKKGDFDCAVSTALKGAKGKPPDDFLLQTVADSYFERAQVEPTKREQWVILAVQYSERALEKMPKDVVNIFNVGESYLSAGMNLQKPSSCNYYQKSLAVFERLKADPTLSGEWGTIEGERVSMEPYRRRLDDKIKQVHQLTGGCPTVAVRE